MRPYIFLFLFLVSGNLFANEPQPWYIYFGSTKIKDTRFSIHHELQVRDFKAFRDHNQTLARVGLQYRFSPLLQTTLGYGYIYSELEDSPNRPFGENRIYQEALLSHDFLDKVGIRHRFRLEERFIEDRDFRGRFRYTLFADIPLTDKGMATGGIYASLYDEVFFNLSHDEKLDSFDRNRAYAALGYKIRDNFGVQLGYMRQHVGKNTGTNHAMLSLHHQLKWR